MKKTCAKVWSCCSTPIAILLRSRAHHRVIHFVGRNPGITVSELLDILKITKQSLSRVLSQLIREGFIVASPGTRDRRQRLLELAPEGVELERRLSESQRARIARAYRDAGAEAVEGYRKVVLGIINESERPKVLNRLVSSGSNDTLRRS